MESDPLEKETGICFFKQVELNVSALPSTKVDEDEVEYTAQLELIETTHYDDTLTTEVQGKITVSF